MEEIKEFSNEVCDELGYYVYRLVDPRNGQTFYVGKGRRNRVFAHANCALASYKDVDYNPDDDNDENLKYKTIRQIKDAGLEVIYIIQKYGLSEQDALKIESVLIDVFSIDRELTNKIKGFNSSEPMNALTLEKTLCVKEYVENPTFPDYMIIKVKDYWLNQRTDRYDCTRRSWKVKLNTVRKYKYVLSVTRGIVKEVYEVTEWHKCLDHDRCEFTGKPAPDNIKNLFINKKIPEKYRKKGQASPCLYSKIDRK